MGFYLDDLPAEPFVIEPPESLDLTLFDDADAVLVAPDGTTTDLVATVDPDDGVVEVAQPAVTAFTLEGIHRLRLTLTGTTARQRIPEVRMVVQDPDSEWLTLDAVREDWDDAEAIADATLWNLLELAREQVIEFAPTLAEGAAVPLRYREGQRMQARNLATANRVDTSGGIGEGDFVIRPFPLDWHVKQILRPKRAVPVVG